MSQAGEASSVQQAALEEANLPTPTSRPPSYELGPPPDYMEIFWNSMQDTILMDGQRINLRALNTMLAFWRYMIQFIESLPNANVVFHNGFVYRRRRGSVRNALRGVSGWEDTRITSDDTLERLRATRHREIEAERAAALARLERRDE